MAKFVGPESCEADNASLCDSRSSLASNVDWNNNEDLEKYCKK